MRVSLTDEEFRLWGEFLAEEYGLRWGPDRREMLRVRLEPRRAAVGAETFEQLLFHVKFHPERHEERARLVPHLTNNESYFCRERGSLDVIRREVLPALGDRAAAEGEARILSAACSTGEEVYTLGILATESGRFGPGRRAKVTGMDLDPVALDRARAARYGEHAFRGTDEPLRTRWFVPAGDDAWEPRPEVRALAEFRRGNLVDGEWWRSLPPQHLILCRNVLIYFGDDAVRRAAESLYRALAPGGYLFLGHAESLRHVPVPFQLERRPGALFYRRPAEGGA